MGNLRVCIVHHSSVGRASPRRVRGLGFKSQWRSFDVHISLITCLVVFTSYDWGTIPNNNFCLTHKRCTVVLVSGFGRISSHDMEKKKIVWNMKKYIIVEYGALVPRVMKFAWPIWLWLLKMFTNPRCGYA